jgi:hypothetical protein
MKDEAAWSPFVVVLVLRLRGVFIAWSSTIKNASIQMIDSRRHSTNLPVDGKAHSQSRRTPITSSKRSDASLDTPQVNYPLRTSFPLFITKVLISAVSVALALYVSMTSMFSSTVVASG